MQCIYVIFDHKLILQRFKPEAENEMRKWKHRIYLENRICHGKR